MPAFFLFNSPIEDQGINAQTHENDCLDVSPKSVMFYICWFLFIMILK